MRLQNLRQKIGGIQTGDDRPTNVWLLGWALANGFNDLLTLGQQKLRSQEMLVHAIMVGARVLVLQAPYVTSQGSRYIPEGPRQHKDAPSGSASTSMRTRPRRRNARRAMMRR